MRCSTSTLAGAGLLAVLTLSAGQAEAAEDPHVTRGRTFVQAHCAGCHAVGRTGESPLAQAPRFRDLHTRYPVTDLAESLAEGIRTGHPSMPEFQLDPGQVEDVIRYLASLER
ncbi:c-type cytochrome [Methylobacterium isbiliense]|jgi:mono/diheme cytochrome c family protein|uniref:Cytochrome c6 n=1 Tax=Methylobacterium isbiliense TaxID=315478 RepID=A0ABQ4SQW0_9HYPH|nr:cytochrome c [Methylobacterium isbiliense]MDN3625937.1 cytochrome c [Methylobacterium isbiliense]GJE04203.1 Cytochrome c6 [Methylobacterium isbiliense]